MKCINQTCQKDIGDVLFCPYCGTKQVKPKAFCTNCGAEMDADAIYCDKCGTKSFFIQKQEEEAERKARLEAERKAKEEAERKARDDAEYAEFKRKLERATPWWVKEGLPR